MSLKCWDCALRNPNHSAWLDLSQTIEWNDKPARRLQSLNQQTFETLLVGNLRLKRGQGPLFPSRCVGTAVPSGIQARGRAGGTYQDSPLTVNDQCLR
jgi:hypothetical protein